MVSFSLSSCGLHEHILSFHFDSFIVFGTPLYTACLVVSLAITLCVLHILDVYNLLVQEKVRDQAFPLQSFSLFHLNAVLNTSCKYSKNHTHFIVSDSSAKHNWDNLIRSYVYSYLYSVRCSFVSILNFFYFLF